MRSVARATGTTGVGRGPGAAGTAVDAPARRAVMDPVFALGPAGSDRRAVRPDAVEADLAELDEHEV